MSKRPFVPSFLQKLDDKLLRNKPATWASRTHLVLYFTVAFALLLSVFCYFAFFDAKQYSSISIWATFVSLLAFIGFVFWLIFLLRFNVFKRYGNWFAMDGLKDFVLYFVCIGSMVAVCFVPSAVESFRANQQFGNDEIVKDINELNVNACRLEHNLLPVRWKVDSCKVVAQLNTITVPPDAEEDVTKDSAGNEIVNYIPRKNRYIDTAELSNKLQHADSLLKINDSAYVFYECPDYRFVSSYNADDYSSVKLLKSADIYNKFLKNYQKPDRNDLLKRMQELKTKYAVRSRYYYESEDYYPTTEDATYDVKIKKKYSLNSISNGIDNVIQKKYAWKQDWPIYLRIFYYTALILTMLVFIFRHSTVKTFFLSLLTAILLTIISGIILVFNHSSEETTLLSFMILYYVVFAVMALSIFKTNIRKAAQGIGLNLFLFTTPFVPLVFFGLYSAYHYGHLYTDTEYVFQDPKKTALYFLIAEIAGSVILVILIQPLFKGLYRKWYSAPEE